MQPQSIYQQFVGDEESGNRQQAPVNVQAFSPNVNVVPVAAASPQYILYGEVRPMLQPSPFQKAQPRLIPPRDGIGLPWQRRGTSFTADSSHGVAERGGPVEHRPVGKPLFLLPSQGAKMGGVSGSVLCTFKPERARRSEGCFVGRGEDAAGRANGLAFDTIPRSYI